MVFLLGNIILDGGGEQRQTHFLVGTRERSHCWIHSMIRLSAGMNLGFLRINGRNTEQHRTGWGWCTAWFLSMFRHKTHHLETFCHYHCWEDTTVVIWVLTWRWMHSNDKGISGDSSGHEDSLKIGMHNFFTSALSTSTWDPMCGEVTLQAFAFSSLHLYLQSSLVFKMICGLPEEAAKGSLAIGMTNQHIWKWFQRPPHSAASAWIPSCLEQGWKKRPTPKVDASKGGAVGEQDSLAWKQNIGLRNLQPFEISNGILTAETPWRQYPGASHDLNTLPCSSLDGGTQNPDLAHQVAEIYNRVTALSISLWPAGSFNALFCCRCRK